MKTKLTLLLAILALLAGINQAAAQGTTAFTYQGQLRDGGTNANGSYTMIFALYDSASGGTQIGSDITNSPTLGNGLFTVNLDFGAGAFNGSARWLDITITNGGTTQELSPRVQVLPTPYALYAASANIAVSATTANGVAASSVTGTGIASSTITAGKIASGQVVKSLNGLTDTVSLSAGTNVTLTTNGNVLQISAAASGGVVVSNKFAAGNNVGLFTNSGIVQISSFVPNMQFFKNVTNATFTVPTNVTRIMVEMWGTGGGGGSGNGSFSGGGGGAGAYAMNIFTVTAGTSYLVTAGGPTVGGQSGGTSSFSGNSISMTAGGGSAGGNATFIANGAGGAVGTATGGMFQAGDNGQPGGNNGGGQGGGVWRGSPGSYLYGPAISGPGGGGSGNASGSGSDGNSGLVLVYY